MESRSIERVADELNRKFNAHLDSLRRLVQIPSVSFPGFPPDEVHHCAQSVASLLKDSGLENVELLELEGAFPYVYGERLKAPGAPTLLLYAHYDVQPPGREELWKTPPFEPTDLEGPGGLRMFARGAADDKAGIIVHTSAISSFLETWGELPVNVKVVIEGEEEIGSSHLLQFLQKYRSKLDADVLVLTDTANLDCGIPALTVALRGLIGVEVEVRALSKAVHSGMWGGPVPDPAMALSKMLATLVDERGRIAIPEILEQVRPLTAKEEEDIRAIPFEEAEFRKQVGMVEGATLLREGPSPMGQLFRFPSLTVNAIQASSRKQAGNIINDTAWAKVTIRAVPDMDPKKCAELLQDHLKKVAPWGVEVKFTIEALGSPWMTDPIGVAFEAAEAAMERGYGRAPYKIGCGGSIPFVEPFAKALGGAPALLVGVEDPYTNAHGENESLLISDLKKACLSQVYLFEEIAQRWKPSNP